MRIALTSLLLSLCVATATAAPVPAFAHERSAEAVPQQKTGMVFVANTGLEDVATLTSSLRHAIAARESGHLDEVVWLVYGRAIVALDPTVSAVPTNLRDQIRAAHEAGVRVVACERALEKYGIDVASLEPFVEHVPNAVSELARLVSQGYAVMRY